MAVALAFIALGFSFWGGAFVLRPMDQAAKAKTAPVQFTILDFFSLTAYFAVPLALVAGIARNEPGAQRAMLITAIGGCLVAWLIWWGSVRTAAKAGIRHVWKRLLMIGLVVPLTYAVTLVGGAYVCWLIGDRAAHDKPTSLWFYLIIATWAAYFFIARRIVLWILSADAPKEAVGNPWSESDSLTT
jgi:hypothetical protein